jgi:hypothetical protein
VASEGGIAGEAMTLVSGAKRSCALASTSGPGAASLPTTRGRRESRSRPAAVRSPLGSGSYLLALDSCITRDEGRVDDAARQRSVPVAPGRDQRSGGRRVGVGGRAVSLDRGPGKPAPHVQLRNVRRFSRGMIRFLSVR